MDWGRARFALAALVAVGVLGPAHAGDEPPRVPQRPGLSDFFRYEQRRVTVRGGKDALGKPALVTVRGSDFRDDGQYLPAALWRQDLPRLIAFRFVPAGTRTWTFRFHSVVECVAEAAFVSQPAQDGGTTVQARWTFASRAKGDEKWSIRDGAADATLSVGADGLVRRARVSLSYRMPTQDPDADDAAKSASDVWEFTWKQTLRSRYEGFHADVNAAIDRGVSRLRKEQAEAGTFAAYKDYVAGTTALGLYTLLACGVPRDDPQVAKGLAWLTTQQTPRNYELALGLMAMERAYVEPGNAVSEAKSGAEMSAERRAWCARAAARLEAQNAAAGSFGYALGGAADSSNTQYAALGLRAAARLGIPVSDDTWAGLIRHFAQRREKDAPRAELLLVGETESAATTATRAAVPVREAAGFLYQAGESRVRASMTAAGIACLAIARDELRRSRTQRFTPADEAQVESMIAGGWAWLDRHWAIDRHVGRNDDAWQLYWLYSLERAGLLTGVRLVNGKDWYFDGSMQLLANQATDGSWKDDGGLAVSTCFALLFLRRATAPAAAPTGR